MTTVYLVRHAHAIWSPDEERPLSHAGAADAETVADRLAVSPIRAIYSSPSRRAIDTVAPLAARLGLPVARVADLRERTLPVVPEADFDALVREAWSFPTRSPRGGESNVASQTRGLHVLRRGLAEHAGQHVVLSTHGNLMMLIMNALDPTFGYECWRRLSFPDIYSARFEGNMLAGIERRWTPGLATT